MNQVIVVLCALLAIAYAEDHVDNYIKINRDQYKRVVDGYDTRLDNFRQYYEGRVEAVGVQKDMILASIVHTEERFNPLVLLNDLTKQCVMKYSKLVARVEATEEEITKCALIATTQLNGLLNAALKVRDELESHIKDDFESELAKCGEESENYTSCVSAVIVKTNKFTHENEKLFEYELEAAECIAKANVKKVVDCTYDIQYNVLTVVGKVNALVDRCLDYKSDCKPCEEYTCEEAVDVYAEYQNQTIANPLYGRSDYPQCLMLNIHEHSN